MAAVTSRKRLHDAAGDAWAWEPEVEASGEVRGAFVRRPSNSALFEQVEVRFVAGADGPSRFHSGRYIITTAARLGAGAEPAHEQRVGLGAALSLLRRR